MAHQTWRWSRTSPHRVCTMFEQCDELKAIRDHHEDTGVTAGRGHEPVPCGSSSHRGVGTPGRRKARLVARAAVCPVLPEPAASGQRSACVAVEHRRPCGRGLAAHVLNEGRPAAGARRVALAHRRGRVRDRPQKACERALHDRRNRDHRQVGYEAGAVGTRGASLPSSTALTSRSASAFRSRGTHSKVMRSNRPASSCARA